MIVATAGHVDHGKTLLLKALTGVDTDRLPEEKRTGLSIDLGFAYCELDDGHSLGFVDVPGHERFIRNMLAGIAGIDFALLVVAADDGPMPQTRDHVAILDLLGIDRGAVALSKIDRVDPARVAAATRDVDALLQGRSLAGAPVFPVSGVTGEGIPDLRAHLDQAARLLAERDVNGNFRLAIDRAFSVTGAGIVVTGAVFSGRVEVGDRLLLSPRGERARVRAIQAQNRPAGQGVAGQRCAINIAGPDLELARIRRGDWLVEARAHAPTDRLDASLRVRGDELRPLAHWTPAHLYLGAADVTCRIAHLELGAISPGGNGLAQLVVDRPIGALRGDRFVLRDQSARRTIAGGIVIDPFAPARGRARPPRIAWLRAMDQATPAEAADRLLAERATGVDLAQFARAWNLTAVEAENLFAGLSIRRIDAGETSWGFAPAHWDACRQALLAAVAGWHRQKPECLGPSDHELRRVVGFELPIVVLRRILCDLVDGGQLARRGSIVHDPAHSPRASTAELELWPAAEERLAGGGLRPPPVGELAEMLELETKHLLKFLQRAAQLGWLIRVAPNRYFPPATVRALANIAEALAAEADGGEFDARSFRDHSGIGRNLTIEVLEYFDRAGLTRRTRRGRKIVAPSHDVFGDGIRARTDLSAESPM